MPFVPPTSPNQSVPSVLGLHGPWAHVFEPNARLYRGALAELRASDYAIDERGGRIFSPEGRIVSSESIGDTRFKSDDRREVMGLSHILQPSQQSTLAKNIQGFDASAFPFVFRPSYKFATCGASSPCSYSVRFNLAMTHPTTGVVSEIADTNLDPICIDTNSFAEFTGPALGNANVTHAGSFNTTTPIPNDATGVLSVQGGWTNTASAHVDLQLIVSGQFWVSPNLPPYTMVLTALMKTTVAPNGLQVSYFMAMDTPPAPLSFTVVKNAPGAGFYYYSYNLPGQLRAPIRPQFRGLNRR